MDHLIISFEKWLVTIGYAPSTVYTSVRHITAFFFYLKTKGITRLEDIAPAVIADYHRHLQTRANSLRPGGLSDNYITGGINALRRFSRYLEQTDKQTFQVKVKTKVDKHPGKTILTTAEIQALYRACGNDTLGIRDRAMLGIYYGCALRKSEGIALDVKDVLLKEKLLHVRSGKGSRERYVPMTCTVAEDLENYIHVAREKICSYRGGRQEALLLSRHSRRMCGNAITDRIRYLAGAAGIQKSFGLHALRHSIATHLLQSGMPLEDVSRFLGHSSLESTQIYTHLANG